MKPFLLAFALLLALSPYAQTKPFRFAFISDTHIGSPNGGAEEDLRRTVADINSRKDLAFVVITGDITELGKNTELALAKRILDSLRLPYYIIPGNHDAGWSESGGLSFTQTFGNDKFHFVFNGVHFIGCASGPYVRMSDGHVPRSAVNWLDSTLKKIGNKEPVIFLNHYPLDNGLDNWYEIIDRLKNKNTILALCGHGHNNRTVKAEDIPAVMGRSNLRAKEAEGGLQPGERSQRQHHLYRTQTAEQNGKRMDRRCRNFSPIRQNKKVSAPRLFHQRKIRKRKSKMDLSIRRKRYFHTGRCGQSCCVWEPKRLD